MDVNFELYRIFYYRCRQRRLFQCRRKNSILPNPPLARLFKSLETKLRVPLFSARPAT